jgi:hypothetical protein
VSGREPGERAIGLQVRSGSAFELVFCRAANAFVV